MSGTRMARSGRCRMFVCLGIVVLMFGMIAIFHSSQQQLDDAIQQRIRCDQQQEALNERLQSFVEQKAHAEQNQKRDRNENMETVRNLQNKLKDLSEGHAKEQLESHNRLEKLEQTHKLLQSEHNDLVVESAKFKKLHLEQAKILQKNLETAQLELQKNKKAQGDEISDWKEKYANMQHENKRLEILVSAADVKGNLQSHIAEMQHKIAEYEKFCDLKSKLDVSHSKAIKEPFNGNMLSFNVQESVSTGLYHIPVKATTNTLNKTNTNQADAVAAKNINQAKGSIINSVENFQIAPKPLNKLAEETETQLKQQPDNAVAASVPATVKAASPGDKMISPLSAPRKSTSTEAAKSANNVLEANVHLSPAANVSQAAKSSSSTTSLPPLPLPPNQRKLPDNVAPIPAFDDLLKNEAAIQKAAVLKKPAQLQPSDIDAAVEELQKIGRHANAGNNNRYANVVDGLEQKSEQKPLSHAHDNGNDDSGAHEVKDHDFINDQNFNVPADDDNNNNFFDGAAKNEADEGDKQKDDNEDEDMMGAAGAGDIAVKNHNNLLDADSLNNEVAGDQGKEFDGLRLEDNADEDEDEDDYSNMAARKKGAEAFRH